MTLEFKPIPKKGALKFNIKGMSKALRKALEVEGKVHKRMLRWTTRRWEGSKPQFVSKVSVSSTRLWVTTAPRGKYPPTGQTASSIWWYLEEGTEIRWALMSDDWRSKTVSARLRSRGGRGKVLIAGKRAMMKRNIGPRPGIEPRNWRAEINRLRSRKFKGMLQRVFKIEATNWITPTALRR
jgi:hypothetical protein